MTNLKDDDAVVQVLQCHAHDVLLCLVTGVAYALPAYKVPLRLARLAEYCSSSCCPSASTSDRDRATCRAAFPRRSSCCCSPSTAGSRRLRCTPSEAHGARPHCCLALRRRRPRARLAVHHLRLGDPLLGARPGRALPETSQAVLRASGRQSRGVKSMRMGKDDSITDMSVVRAASDLDEGSSPSP